MDRNRMQEKTVSFDEFESVQRLRELSLMAPDMTDPVLFSPERIKILAAKGAGIKMLYAPERVDETIIAELEKLAMESDALSKMKRMQAGEVMNCIKGHQSENRAVLHTATRDFFGEAAQAGPAKEAKMLAKAECDKLKDFLAGIGDQYSELFMIGIGGSDLGPSAIYYALQHLLIKGRKIHFINNIDPDSLALSVKDADLKRSLAVVVSKSGSTIETKTNEEFLREKFKKAGLDPGRHFIAVTGEGSAMDDPKRYMKIFYIWDWIGGRYSSTSMVGGVLLGFAFGFEPFYQFLEGAHAMDQVALEEDIRSNLPLMGALLSLWNRNFLGMPTLAIIPYAQGLARFPAHIQQLSMESNGKHIDKEGNKVSWETGMVIWGEPGTNAQHSFFQLIHQGTDAIPLEFIGFKESRFGDDFTFEKTTSQEKLIANLIAQSIALATGQKSANPNKEFLGNRPSHLLIARRQDPYTIGALLAYFEHKVAFEGFIWNINSFDQEGVQLGKVLANKVLNRMPSLSSSTDPFPLADAFIKHFADV